MFTGHNVIHYQTYFLHIPDNSKVNYTVHGRTKTFNEHEHNASYIIKE